MQKVLIVDDMNSWINFHKQKLELEGNFIVDTAVCARLALDKIYENITKPYELIITDLQMESDFEPKYAGEWLIEQIQTLPAYKNCKIIISSGCTGIRYVAESLNVDYIPKRIACTDEQEYERVVLGRT